MDDITVTIKCNNRCVFCVKDVLKDVHIDTKHLKALLEKNQDKKRVTLTGGEVTILGDILEIVSFCKKVGYENISIITNGRRLSNWSFLNDLVNSGVNEIAISLYSTLPEIHDDLTRTPGSCKETLKGISNVLKLKEEMSDDSLSVRVNILINSRNISTMYSTLRSLYEMGVRDFLLLDIIGLYRDDFFVSFNKILKLYLALSIDSRLNGCHFVFRGYPPCIFTNFIREIDRKQGYVRLMNNNSSNFQCELQEFATHWVASEDKFFSYIEKCKKLFAQPKTCKKCVLSHICLGFQKKYLDTFSDMKAKRLEQHLDR